MCGRIVRAHTTKNYYNMKALKRLLITILSALTILSSVAFIGCQPENPDNEGNKPGQEIDYVSNLKLDFSSKRVRTEVTVRQFIDGDTTHFNPKSNAQLNNSNYDFPESNGIIKARYLAIDTPESTGKIEEWGKAAANFTRSKLESAQSIIVESDSDKWETDTTGERMLSWVWYLPQGSNEYRNLNVEILQNGYAHGSKTGLNCYGEIALSSMAQAKAFGYHVWSKEKDPDFYYGAAIGLTLKELRTNIEEYNGKVVSFEGVVNALFENTAYVEEYDAELDIYFGMQVYLGFNSPGDVLSAMERGNRVRVVGTVSYYEAGETYQVSGLTYNFLDPEDETNTLLISKNNEPAFPVVEPSTFVNGKFNFIVEKTGEDGEVVTETKQFSYGQAVIGSSIAMNNLTVTSVSTTTNEASSNNGALTLTCQAPDGTVVKVRTEPFYENGALVTANKYKGKTINVKGIVDYYKGYQIKAYRMDYITIVD